MKKVSKIAAVITALATCLSAGIISVSAADIGNQQADSDQGEVEMSYNQIEIFKAEPSKNGVDDFISAYGEKDYMKKEDCYNITPSEISQKYGLNIFKFRKSCVSVLLYNDKTYVLGDCFGSFGTLSFAVADINRDGSVELYFTYSWGSGLHRSEIGYFDTKNEEYRSNFEFAYPEEDMVLINDNGVLAACRVDKSIGEWYENYDFETVIVPAQKVVEIVYDGNEITYRKLCDEIYDAKVEPDSPVIIHDNVKGDANGDGTFNVADIMILQKWFLGQLDAEVNNQKAVDLSGDGIINVLDLCLMKQELVKKA